MKAIHTYVPTNVGFEFNKNVAYNMLLSLLYAKIHYENVELYTNQEIADLVTKLEYPYDKIVVEPFDGFKSKTFSIPKIITYSLQTEEYTHLDIDTFLFSKINTPKTIDFFFAHPDIILSSKNNFQFGMNMYETYLKNTYEIKDKIPDFIKNNIDFTSIPNMNVFGVRDYKIVSKAANFCLNFYEENKNFFDSSFYNACIIEQLLMPAAIKHYYNDYYENYYLIESDNVFRIKHGTDDITKVTYPLEIFFDKNRLLINEEPFLYQFVKYDYRTIVHLGGFKNLDVMQFLVKETIVERFDGLNTIKNIDNIFKYKTPSDDISDRYYVHILNSFNGRFKKSKTNLI